MYTLEHQPSCIYIYMQHKTQLHDEQATGAAGNCSQHTLPTCGVLQKLLKVTIEKYVDSTSSV